MKFLKFTAMLFVLALGGCGTEVMMVSKPVSFNGTDSFFFRKPPRDFMALAQSVGISLGYHIEAVDRSQNTVTLSKTGNLGVTVLLGKVKEVHITIQMLADHRTVKLTDMLTGNFKNGSQQTADKLIEELKAKLLEPDSKVGQ